MTGVADRRIEPLQAGARRTGRIVLIRHGASIQVPVATWRLRPVCLPSGSGASVAQRCSSQRNAGEIHAAMPAINALVFAERRASELQEERKSSVRRRGELKRKAGRG
jgi:hypothetical protein